MATPLTRAATPSLSKLLSCSARKLPTALAVNAKTLDPEDGEWFQVAPFGTSRFSPDDGKTYADPKLKVVDGELPDIDAIELLTGQRLYDPGYNGHGQPKYAKDVEAWMRRVDQQGVM